MVPRKWLQFHGALRLKPSLKPLLANSPNVFSQRFNMGNILRTTELNPFSAYKNSVGNLLSAMRSNVKRLVIPNATVLFN
jgi:hypothetical protein